MKPLNIDIDDIKKCIKEILSTYSSTALWQLAASTTIQKTSINPYSTYRSDDAWTLAPIVGAATIIPDLGKILYECCKKVEPHQPELRNKKIVLAFNDMLANFFTGGLWQIFYNLSRRNISPSFYPNAASVGGLSAVVGLFTQVLFLKAIKMKSKICFSTKDYCRDRVLSFIACFCISMAFVLTDIQEHTDYFLSSCLPDNKKICDPIEDAGKAGLTGLIGIGVNYLLILLGYVLYLFITSLVLPGASVVQTRWSTWRARRGEYRLLTSAEEPELVWDEA
jgi:hypothetical protein